MGITRWIAAVVASAAALLSAGCDVELEAELVNVEGLNPGFKIHAGKDGGKITGTVGPSGEVTIWYKGEEIHHVSGLKPGSDFEYEPEDPWVVQMPPGYGIDYAYAVSDADGSVYPLRVYDMDSFVRGPAGEFFVAEPGMELTCIGFDLDTTPNGTYTVHVQIDAPAPGPVEMKIINAVIARDDTGQEALLPVEPVTYEFSQVQNWPYVQQLFIVDAEVEFLDGRRLGLPDPDNWQYCKVELRGAQPGVDYDQGVALAPYDEEWNQVWADWNYQLVGDVDGDNTPDLVVRFSRQDLRSNFGPGVHKVVASGSIWGAGWNSYKVTEWLPVDAKYGLKLDIPLHDEEMVPFTSLDWWMDVAVTGSPSVQFDYWILATLPDATEIPLLQFAGLDLPQGFTYQGFWGLPVPAGLPPGTYRFDNVFGDFATGTVYAADGFEAFVAAP